MDKGRLLRVIKEILLANEGIVFAYLYGSIINQETFKDIDLGIFVKNAGENPLVISSDIKTQLSRRAKKEGLKVTADEFDVRILNEAPFTFLKRVFQEGTLILDRDPDLRTDLIEYVSRKYRECAGILAEASLR
jgi:predicted nucleotidyltransferase